MDETKDPRAMRRAWIVAILLGSAVLGLLGACNGSLEALPPSSSGPDAATAPDAPVENVIDARGGSVRLGDGAAIVVPPGAIDRPVAFSIRQVSETLAPSGVAFVGNTYVLEPEGIVFTKPVEVRFAFDPGRLPRTRLASDVSVHTAANQAATYEALPTKLVDETHVAAETLHFSLFVAGAPTSRRPPSAAGFACTRTVCANYRPGACGKQPDGCGDYLDCGTECSDAGEVCVPHDCSGWPTQCGVFPNFCGGTIRCTAECATDGGVCTPKTCDAFGSGACGTYHDGCGHELFCTSGCQNGQSPDCRPETCYSGHGSTCGTYTDVCGGRLECVDHCRPSDGGACPSTEPVTCRPDECRVKFGACGEPISCTGGCPPPTVADAGIPCTPPSCQAGECGTHRDSCGNYFICNGGCPEATCVPLACDGLRLCGRIADGCGGTRDCVCGHGL